MIRAVAAQLLDRRLIGWSVLLTVVALVGFGLASAIIPNPVFGRSIAPEPFAVAVWIASAPLIGIVTATYVVPPPTPPLAATIELRAEPAPAADDAGGGALGWIGGFAAFLAIGCPVCNKVALLVLGTGGAMSIWAPLQPLVGVASLALLAGTLAWRLHRRAQGGACAVGNVSVG